MPKTIYKLPAAIVATLALATSVSAQSTSTETETATRINRANEIVREGKFSEAIEGYLAVDASESNRDQLNYNLAVAKFRSGDIEAAKSLFRQSAASSDAALAASGRYNLGNCFYAGAVNLADHDRPAAIDSLREAISHYRGSLVGNSQNADARANIELAVDLIRKLQDQQQQDQQQQDQQQQDQQQQDQQQQDQQQQGDQNSEQQNSDSSENDSKSADSRDQSQDRDPSESQDQSAQSEADGQQSNDADSDAEQSENQDSDSGEQSPQQQPESQSPTEPNSQDESSASQPQNQDVPSRWEDQQRTADSLGEEDDQNDTQDVPEGELTANEVVDSDQDPRGQAAIQDPNAKDQPMTKQEALKMLQAVRDRDMLRRMKHDHEQKRRHVTVDRDW